MWVKGLQKTLKKKIKSVCALKSNCKFKLNKVEINNKKRIIKPTKLPMAPYPPLKLAYDSFPFSCYRNQIWKWVYCVTNSTVLKLRLCIHMARAVILTCCVVLVIVDELCDGVKIMLFCQVILALLGGADVIMSAASNSFPVERRVTRVDLVRTFSLEPPNRNDLSYMHN